MSRTLSFVLLAIVLLLMLVYGCGCTRNIILHTQHTSTATNADQYASSYQVLAKCRTNERVAGSAVAVGPRHLITAKHVVEACELAGKVTWIILVNGQSTRVEVRVAKVSKEHDAALLEVVGETKLPVWSTLSPRVPHVGERVCVLASTPTVARVRKCGEIFRVRADLGKFLVSVHVVPGNSGGPVFDAVGQVIGIVATGRWLASDEFFGGVTISSAWKDIWPSAQ